MNVNPGLQNDMKDLDSALGRCQDVLNDDAVRHGKSLADNRKTK